MGLPGFYEAAEAGSGSGDVLRSFCDGFTIDLTSASKRISRPQNAINTTSIKERGLQKTTVANSYGLTIKEFNIHTWGSFLLVVWIFFMGFGAAVS